MHIYILNLSYVFQFESLKWLYLEFICVNFFFSYNYLELQKIVWSMNQTKKIYIVCELIFRVTTQDNKSFFFKIWMYYCQNKLNVTFHLKIIDFCNFNNNFLVFLFFHKVRISSLDLKCHAAIDLVYMSFFACKTLA